MKAMKLYNYWRSSASWRVRLALAHKGLPYEYVPVSIVAKGEAPPEQLSDAHLARNPMAQVPALELEIGGKTRVVTQSIAIVELLDELYPEKPLLPSDPFLRAHARELAEIVNSGIQPFQNLAPTAYLREHSNLDAKAFTQHFIAKGMAALERAAAPYAGRFLVGDSFTIADACLVPQLYTARRFEVPLDAYPTLLRAEASCSELSGLDAAHPSKQIDAQPT